MTLTDSGATTAAGLSLIFVPVAGVLVMTLPYGYLLYPLPLVVAVPAMLLPGASTLLAGLIPALLFWAWSFHLFRGATRLPVKSAFLFWVLVALTLLYFAFSWSYGVVWQGYLHVFVVVGFNLVSIYILWRFLRNAKIQTSFRHNLIFHWALFAWLGWLAFPYLGEFP